LSEARGLGRRNPDEGHLKALQVTAAQAHHRDELIAPAPAPAGSPAGSPGPAVEKDTIFFRKDYPFDKRPKADPFHFHHPYPAVQDSSEFDADYVKDENSDNGYWKAQTTYDKLRQKAQKEKEDVEKALKRKSMDEDELKEAMERHEKEKAAHAEAQKKAAAKKKAERDAAKAAAAKGEGMEKEEDNIGGAAGEGMEKDLDEASGKTKSEMEELEECKKQLKEAQEKLKKLMDELEEAKKAQESTEAAVDSAYSKQLQAEGSEKSVEETVKSESAHYQDSREAYLKQKAIVDKMEADIQVAAAKVQAMRDAEDKDGGVYPAKQHSGATGGAPFAGALVIASTAFVLSLF